MTDITDRLLRYAGGMCVSTPAEQEAAVVISDLRAKLKLAEEEALKRLFALCKIEAERDFLRAEINEIQNQKAYVYYDDDTGMTYTQGAIDDGCEIPTNLRPLYARPTHAQLSTSEQEEGEGSSYKELNRLARQVDDGAGWQVSPAERADVVDKDGSLLAECKTHDLAAFVAKANPATILGLIGQLALAEKDAARYRWLRKKVGVELRDGNAYLWLPSGGTKAASFSTETDVAIDAAIEGDKK